MSAAEGRDGIPSLEQFARDIAASLAAYDDIDAAEYHGPRDLSGTPRIGPVEHITVAYDGGEAMVEVKDPYPPMEGPTGQPDALPAATARVVPSNPRPREDEAERWRSAARPDELADRLYNDLLDE